MKSSIISKRELFPSSEIKKIDLLQNQKILEFISHYIDLMEPSSIFLVTDSREDYEYIRRKSLEEGEERQLAVKMHTYHFDNYYDQARDKENTKILTPNGENLPFINTMERSAGIAEVEGLMKGIMRGRTMIIGFFSLGPKDSPFSMKGVQITDSYYVMHSDMMLYRTDFDYFVRNPGADFLRFVHSQGEVDTRKVSKNLKNRRIYFDLDGNRSLSVNTQYAGNTVGPKKLAFRITINRALKEGWLSEHMFLMGVNGSGGRITYLTGAFPSACGKTSTSMIPSEKIVGDDLVFIKEDRGKARAINVENGVFGIIDGVNEDDDAKLWNAIYSDREVIFSNVLVHNGEPFWNGMGVDIPDSGENHSGIWKRGNKDAEGNEITPSHKNARFTISLDSFDGLDREALEAKEGVVVGGMIFGGRDSDTWPPVCESLNWNHGVINKGASIESETTAATLGKTGVRTFNPMSIMEFMSVDLGKYVRNYLDFGAKLKDKPLIFAVNYFLKENGKFLNEKIDKAVWLKWMEKRIHGEIGAVLTPIGYIPKYEDLKPLFKSVLNKDYTVKEYEEQFRIRVAKLIEKDVRIKEIYKGIRTTPAEVFRELDEEIGRLKKLKEEKGDSVSPVAQM
ncbi:MAG: phosphoenolpyruvate carboxykinase (GTP) [Candidatus Thermoplasmatota archaeon]|jgi:phosphoenolpyruvate carboxykinase (GTP)|nr:phosphoenolpyruvate carboxykinase (GTP) [Candidatus Thermoplasmatota archaeon]MCL5789120.1 phosphoenolpyruvate carboxykinase (GTP) [Candidatus Thermoplasmatota archaeon]